MARTPDKAPRPSRITIPERCHAAVKVVFAEMHRQGVTYDELEHRSGVLKSTFKAWRTNNRPGLETMEAALGSLGWAFLPVPSLSQLPPSIRERLQALAAEWGDVNPLITGLIGAMVEPHQARLAGRKVSHEELLQRRLTAAWEEISQLREQLRFAIRTESRAERSAFYGWRHRRKERGEIHA